MQGVYAMVIYFCLFVFICLLVSLSPVKSVKSFTTGQHLAASGGLLYRFRYTCYIYAHIKQKAALVNPLIATLKPQSNGPSYSNIVIGTLAADGWAVTFGTASRGLGRAAARPVPSSLYQM